MALSSHSSSSTRHCSTQAVVGASKPSLSYASCCQTESVPASDHDWQAVRRCAKNAGLKWRLRHQGPQLTQHNVEVRKRYKKWMKGLSKIQRRCIVYTDSVPLTGSHSTNTHNEGLWVFNSDPVPPTPRLRRPDAHDAAVTLCRRLPIVLQFDDAASCAS